LYLQIARQDERYTSFLQSPICADDGIAVITANVLTGEIVIKSVSSPDLSTCGSDRIYVRGLSRGKDFDVSLYLLYDDLDSFIVELTRIFTEAGKIIKERSCLFKELEGNELR